MCLVASFIISLRAFGHLNAWLEASQRRVEITESALGQFKSVALAGFMETLLSRISALREIEVQISKGHRSMVVGVLTMGMYKDLRNKVNTLTNLNSIFIGGLGTYYWLRPIQLCTQHTGLRHLRLQGCIFIPHGFHTFRSGNFITRSVDLRVNGFIQRLQ